MPCPLLERVNQLENEELAEVRRQERNDCWAVFGKCVAALVVLVGLQYLIGR
jgi:hypothetical protein